VIVLNKSDIVNHAFAIEWMRDYETFLDAINRRYFYEFL
jgi:GPN-loop GTPase